MPFIYLSKLDVAKRQLDTAIKLHFQGGDFVAIHSLSRNAHEILEALCKAQGIKSEFGQVTDMIRPEKVDEFTKKINKPKNFFKHGSHDQKETIEFNPDSSEYFLWDACRLYAKLTGERPKNILIYDMWFSIRDPQLFSEEKIRGQLIEIKNSFNLGDRAKFYEEASRAYELLDPSIKRD